MLVDHVHVIGVQFVTTTGIVVMLKLFVDNLVIDLMVSSFKFIIL